MKKSVRLRYPSWEQLESKILLAADGVEAGTSLEAITVQLDDPSGYETAAIVLSVRTTDSSVTGHVNINGREQLDISSGLQNPVDGRLTEFAFTTPADWWSEGENEITFSYDQHQSYQVVGAKVVLVNNPAPIELTLPSQAANVFHVYHPLDPHAPSDSMRDLKAAVKMLTPGDTLIVHQGVYRESFGHADIPGGESWLKPVTIQAEGTVILRPDVGASRVFTFSHEDTHHVIIDGIVMDATNVNYEAVKITSGVGYSHNIWIRNSEIRYAPASGVLVNGPTYQNRFTNVHVHNNGRSGLHHGFYIASSNNVVENSMIDHNSGWGVHVYLHRGTISDNIVRNNVVHNNGTSGRGFGIGLYRGPGHQALNNILFENTQGGIAYGYGSLEGTVISGNTIYDHRGFTEIMAASTEKETPTLTDNDIRPIQAPWQIPQPKLVETFSVPLFEPVSHVNDSPESTTDPIDTVPPPVENEIDAVGQVTPIELDNPGPVGGDPPANVVERQTLAISVGEASPVHLVELNATKRAEDDIALLTLEVIDADSAVDGTLHINGKGPIKLFSSEASEELHNRNRWLVTVSMPAQWWRNGFNYLVFKYRGNDGFEIISAGVSFSTGLLPIGSSPPTSAGVAIAFDTQIVDDGGMSGRRRRG